MGGRCQVAKGTYRDILERRARENAVDFVEGVATALTPTAFFETFMVKSYKTLGDSYTRVDVNTGIVAPGQVFMPFHFAEANSNLVTLGAFDPISREPNFKQCAVRVEKYFKTLK